MRVSINDQILKDIGDSIRYANGETTKYAPQNMASKIEDLKVTSQTKSISISDNGTQTITPDSGYNYLESVTLNVNVPIQIGEYINLTPSADQQNGNNFAKFITKIPSDFNISNLTSARSMFNEMASLTTIPLLDTSNITDMVYMFYACKNLTTIPLLNTSSVTNMSQMFSSCSSLTTIPLLNTSSVTDMSLMFSTCTSLTTIPLLDTSSVTNMTQMFNWCTSLISIPQIDTSSVTNMSQMFSKCDVLTTIPLLDTSSVTNIYNMFNYCPSLNDTSLNNILQMCINATRYNSTKTLAYIGFSRNNYSTQRIQALSNYQAFINAGWTIGY